MTLATALFFALQSLTPTVFLSPPAALAQSETPVSDAGLLEDFDRANGGTSIVPATPSKKVRDADLDALQRTLDVPTIAASSTPSAIPSSVPPDAPAAGPEPATDSEVDALADALSRTSETRAERKDELVEELEKTLSRKEKNEKKQKELEKRLPRNEKPLMDGKQRPAKYTADAGNILAVGSPYGTSQTYERGVLKVTGAEEALRGVLANAGKKASYVVGRDPSKPLAYIEESRRSGAGRTSVRYGEERFGVTVIDGGVDILMDGDGNVLGANVRSPMLEEKTAKEALPDAGATEVRAAIASIGDDLEVVSAGPVIRNRRKFLLLALRDPATGTTYDADYHPGMRTIVRAVPREQELGRVLRGPAYPGSADDDPVLLPHPEAATGAGPSGADGAVSDGALEVALEGRHVRIVNDALNGRTAKKSVGAAEDAVWTAGDATMPELNAFAHLANAYEWLKGLGATLPPNPVTVHVNSDLGGCIARFTPAEQRIDLGPGCGKTENLATYTDILLHEYGHAVANALYALEPDGERGALGEAIADYTAGARSDDASIGEGVFASPRRLENALTMDDWRGDIHADGQIVGGALWDMRRALGEGRADTLVYRALHRYPVTFEEMLYALLAESNPEGDPALLTPEQEEIVSVFDRHGIGPGAAGFRAIPQRTLSPTDPGTAGSGGALNGGGSFSWSGDSSYYSGEQFEAFIWGDANTMYGYCVIYYYSSGGNSGWTCGEDYGQTDSFGYLSTGAIQAPFVCDDQHLGDGYMYDMPTLTATNGAGYSCDLSAPSIAWGAYGNIGASRPTWGQYPNWVKSTTLTATDSYYGMSGGGINCSTSGYPASFPTNGSTSCTVGTGLTGTYTVYVKAQDDAPNQTQSQNSPYYFDNTQPNCGTWSPSSTTWRTSGATTFTLSGSTDAHSGINTSGGSCNVPGSGTCTVTISDYATNTRVCTSPNNNIDPTAPAISDITASSNTPTAGSTVTFYVNATDTGGSGLNTGNALFYLGTMPYGGWNVVNGATMSWDAANARYYYSVALNQAAGTTYRAYTYVYDIAGNQAARDEFAASAMTSSGSTVLTIANSPPPISTPVSPANGGVVHVSPTGGNTTFTTNAVTDADGQTVQYYFRVATGSDGETGAVCNSGWQTSTTYVCNPNVAGTLYWHVYTNDGALQTTPNYVWSFVQNYQPTVISATPTSGWYKAGPMTFTSQTSDANGTGNISYHVFLFNSAGVDGNNSSAYFLAYPNGSCSIYGSSGDAEGGSGYVGNATWNAPPYTALPWMDFNSCTVTFPNSTTMQVVWNMTAKAGWNEGSQGMYGLTYDVYSQTAGWQGSFGTIGVDTTVPANPTSLTGGTTNCNGNGNNCNITNPTIVFNWSGASDPNAGNGSGICNYEYVLTRSSDGAWVYSGNTGNVATYNLATSGLVNGTTYLKYIRTIDCAGNYAGSHYQSGSVLVEQTAPTTNAFSVAPTAGWTATTPVTITTTIADTGGAGLQGYYYKCTTAASYTFVADIDGSIGFTCNATGGQTAYAYAMDNAGNVDASPSTVAYNIDTTTPDIVAVDAGASSADRTSLTSNVWFNAAATGADGIISFSWTAATSPSGTTYYYVYNATATSYITTGAEAGVATTTNAFVDSIASTEGTRYMHVKPRNAAGTWGTERIFIVNYDTTAPTGVSASVSSNAWKLDGSATYTVTTVTSDAGSGIGGTNGLHMSINYLGSNSGNQRGYFTWRPVSYQYAGDQVACTGAGGGFGSKYTGGYNPTTATLVSCSSTVSGAQRTVNFVIRPTAASFGDFAYINDISYYAQDNVDNGMAAFVNQDTNFSSDGTTPTIGMSPITPAAPNGANGWYISNPTLTYNTADATSGLNFSKYSWNTSDATCRASGTAYTNGTTNVLSTQGTNNLYLCNADLAGWTNAFTGTYKLDTVVPPTPPTPSAPTDAAAPFTVSWTAATADPTSGTASCILQVSYNGGAYSTVAGTNCVGASSTTYTPASGDGTYTFRTFHTDDAGLTSASATDAIAYDTVSPTGAPTCTPGTSYFATTVAVTCTAGTGGTVIRYTTDGSAPTAASAVWSNQSFSATTTLRAISCDAANNCFLTPATYTYTQDVAAPTFAVTDDVNGTWNTSPDTVAVSLSDTGTGVASGTAYAFSADASCVAGDSWVSSGTTTDISVLVSTTNVGYVCFRAIDGAGNTGYSIAYGPLRVDTTGPAGGSVSSPNALQNTLTVTVSVNRGTDNPGIGLSATDTDYLLEVEEKVLANNTCPAFTGAWADAGVTETAAATTYSYTGITDRCYRFRYTVKDALGNTTVYTDTTNATKVDSAAPVVLVGIVTKGTTQLTIGAQEFADASNIDVSTRQIWATSCVMTTSSSCTPGTSGWTQLTVGGAFPSYTFAGSDATCYRFQYRAKDNAGNDSDQSSYSGVTCVDWTVGSATIDSFTNGATLAAPPVLAGTAQDAGSGVNRLALQYICDGGATNCSGSGTPRYWNGTSWSTSSETTLLVSCTGCTGSPVTWTATTGPTTAALLNNETYTVLIRTYDGASGGTGSLYGTTSKTWTYVPGITISITDTTPGILGALPPGTATTDGTWYSDIDVTTPSSGGFTLAARRLNGASNTLRLGVTATYFPEMTSYPAAPGTYTANTFAFRLGETGTDSVLRQTTAWGLDSARKWAGLPTADTQLTSTSAYNAAAQNIRVEYRIQATNTQAAGTYTGDIVYTATVTP